LVGRKKDFVWSHTKVRGTLREKDEKRGGGGCGSDGLETKTDMHAA